MKISLISNYQFIIAHRYRKFCKQKCVHTIMIKTLKFFVKKYCNIIQTQIIRNQFQNISTELKLTLFQLSDST